MERRSHSGTRRWGRQRRCVGGVSAAGQCRCSAQAASAGGGGAALRVRTSCVALRCAAHRRRCAPRRRRRRHPQRRVPSVDSHRRPRSHRSRGALACDADDVRHTVHRLSPSSASALAADRRCRASRGGVSWPFFAAEICTIAAAAAAAANVEADAGSRMAPFTQLHTHTHKLHRNTNVVD